MPGCLPEKEPRRRARTGPRRRRKPPPTTPDAPATRPRLPGTAVVGTSCPARRETHHARTDPCRYYLSGLQGHHGCCGQAPASDFEKPRGGKAVPTRHAKKREAQGIPTSRGGGRCTNATFDQTVRATTGQGISHSDAMSTVKRTVRKPARKEGQVIIPQHSQNYQLMRMQVLSCFLAQGRLSTTKQRLWPPAPAFHKSISAFLLSPPGRVPHQLAGVLRAWGSTYNTAANASRSTPNGRTRPCALAKGPGARPRRSDRRNATRKAQRAGKPAGANLWPPKRTSSLRNDGVSNSPFLLLSGGADICRGSQATYHSVLVRHSSGHVHWFTSIPGIFTPC